ncbi:MAG: hypothetical protein JSV87_03660 [Candidatus Bathyarchaeota archaeon]|nr:MAG: hypothetical protein JSV87_03660 [Candidatus Bathyarchaeota archaeon]
MSEKFAGKLEKGVDNRPVTTRIREAIRPPGELKLRLDYAVKRITIQIQNLDKATARFSQRDKSIFAKVVSAYSEHDTTRAQVFANELAQLRKMERMMVHARLALEQIVLRLSTVSELGDVVSTLAPAVGVMRSVKTNMSAVFPEAERELGNIGTLLNGIIVDAGQSTGMNIDFQAAGDDAQRILNEAATVAEQKVKKKFPELPSGTLIFGETAQTKT